MAHRYIKNIIYQDKRKINYLLEKVYRNRLHFLAFKDRLILISTYGKNIQVIQILLEKYLNIKQYVMYI